MAEQVCLGGGFRNSAVVSTLGHLVALASWLVVRAKHRKTAIVARICLAWLLYGGFLPPGSFPESATFGREVWSFERPNTPTQSYEI